MLKAILQELLKKKVERKKEELITIKAEIDNKLENMHYARHSMMEVREDYLYTDLTRLWKKRRFNQRFIKLFA